MMRAYDNLYLRDAKRCLGGAFDYAVHDCGAEIDWFAEMFVRSGIGVNFEQGNPM